MNLVEIETEIAKYKIDNDNFFKFCGAKSCRNCPIYKYREIKIIGFLENCETIWKNISIKSNNRIKYR